MDFEGKAYTLYAISTPHWAEGGLDHEFFVNRFRAAMIDALDEQGLEKREHKEGTPDAEIVVRAWVTDIDPGSAAERSIVGFGAGAAVFEAGGEVGDGTSVWADFQAKGVRRWTWWGGGDSADLLADAARLAGKRAARHILAALDAR